MLVACVLGAVGVRGALARAPVTLLRPAKRLPFPHAAVQPS